MEYREVRINDDYLCFEGIIKAGEDVAYWWRTKPSTLVAESCVYIMNASRRSHVSGSFRV